MILIVALLPTEGGFSHRKSVIERASKQTASDCRISGRAGGQARQVCVHGWCDCDQGGAGEGRAIADLVAAAAGRRGIADLVGRRGFLLKACFLKAFF